MSKQAFLYRLTFPNGKIYIGITDRPIEIRVHEHIRRAKQKNDYAISHAIRKYGNQFLSEILVIGEYSYILNLEIKAIDIFNSLAPNGYNLSLGGDINPVYNPDVVEKLRRFNLGKKLSSETKAKIGLASAGRKQTADQIQKRLRTRELTGVNKHSAETIAKIVQTRKTNNSYIVSDDTRTKLSEIRTGKKHSELTKSRISVSNKGKIFSEETRQKMSASALGKSISQETRNRMSKAHQGIKLTEEAIAKRTATRKANREAKKQAEQIIQQLIEGQHNAPAPA